MPVRKFSRPANSGRPVKLGPETEEFKRALYSVFRLATLFSPARMFPPGVYKFRSLEEAQAQKMAWIRNALQK